MCQVSVSDNILNTIFLVNIEMSGNLSRPSQTDSITNRIYFSFSIGITAISALLRLPLRPALLEKPT